MVTNKYLLGLFIVAVAGCGDGADFAGSAGQRTNTIENPIGEEETPVEEPPEEEQVEVTPLASLTWHWQCATDPGEAPTSDSDEEVVVLGEGPHEFHPGQLIGTPIYFSGQLCPPESVARDIVFVIDTSGSMDDNDRQTGATCGRLRAIQSVIDSVPQGVGRFGVITFNDMADAESNSTQLWVDADQMRRDLERGGDAYADVVCDFGGNTNYTDGLAKARTLLESGDPGATKEIYFVSDGRPTNGDGVLEASQMRYPGLTVGGEMIPVTIATVMLGGTDTVLESKIASRIDDGNGNLVPLHAYAANAQQLAKSLSELSRNEITGGELKYRAIGEVDWTELDLMTHLNGFEFSMEAAEIDWTAAPMGIEVYYSYRDMHGNQFESGGKLLWIKEGETSG